MVLKKEGCHCKTENEAICKHQICPKPCVTKTDEVCTCDKVTPPWWHSPPFWWNGDLARRGIPVGDINDYDFIRPPDELPEPVDMLKILEIERPERYIPGQIHKAGLAGIGDPCLVRHRLAQQKALIDKGICPSEDNKLPGCMCSEKLPAKEIKETDDCKEEIKKKKERIPYCPEVGEVVYKSLQDPKKWPECPCCTNSKKEEHNDDNPVITSKNNGTLNDPENKDEINLEKNGKSNGTLNDPENKNKINLRKNKIENRNGNKDPDFCLCPRTQHNGENAKGNEVCGSPGQVVRPCNKEPYVLFNNESQRPCRDKLRNEEMSKVGLPFKAEACRWFGALHPPLRAKPVGRTPMKLFPEMRYSNL